MSTLAENVTRIANAKTAIKNAINLKGGTLTTELIGSYADAIAALPSGGGSDLSFYECSGCWIAGTTVVVSGAGETEVNDTYYPYSGSSGTTRVWRNLAQTEELFYYSGSSCWVIQRISGGVYMYTSYESGDPWSITWGVHGSSTSPAPTVAQGTAVSAGWKGFQLTQDSTTKAWSKAATETTFSSYPYIKPEYGSVYTSDTSMLATKWYPGGVPVELWQEWYYGSPTTISFVFTDTSNENSHQWISGTYSGADPVSWYVTPGTYYIGGSGFDMSAYYSTDGGSTWTSLSVLYDQSTYKKFSTDGTNPATVTIPASGMVKFCVKYQ